MLDGADQRIYSYLVGGTEHPYFPFGEPPGDVTVAAVIPNHLVPAIGDMEAYGGKPFKGIKDPLLFERGLRVK